MNEEEVLDIGKQLALSKGWPWIVPVQVKMKKRLLGEPYWTILTNCESIGCNVYIEIDDCTQTAVESIFRRASSPEFVG